ncbi:hypothetical protein ABID52_000623 [Fictibacillus halophilus]|uniref:Uncharacterized protein n=2 Tax=Fictibacillus halophilus TaxID=1610490 RepID=A0ABV2LHJ6_9BACL
MYTLKHHQENKRTFHYRSATFELPVIVDKNGFVLEYPETIRKEILDRKKEFVVLHNKLCSFTLFLNFVPVESELLFIQEPI